MDLKNFVASTLTQIVEGVAEAAGAVAELGGVVSPAYSPASPPGERLGVSSDGTQTPVYGVAFDVALVSASMDANEAGGGLRVAGLGFGGKVSGNEKEEITSRVRFLVPLQLPTDPTSANRAKKLSDEADAKVRAYNSGLAG
jgi:hypothetical protein